MIQLGTGKSIVVIPTYGRSMTSDRTYLLIVQNTYTKCMYYFDVGAVIPNHCGYVHFELDVPECFPCGQYDYWFVEDNGFDLDSIDINRVAESLAVSGASLTMKCSPLYFNGSLLMLSDPSDSKSAVTRLNIVSRGMLRYASESTMFFDISVNKGISDNVKNQFGYGGN